MRVLIISLVFLTLTLRALGQVIAAPAPGLPTEPAEIFAAAAPFYDFNAETLKPWHLKATYQLYDEQGKPTEQGIYEYWWASPKVHRSSWTRPEATHTDWQIADGKYAHETSGQRLKFFEYELQSKLLSPMSDVGALDYTKVRLDRESVKLGDIKLPCVMVIPLMPQHGKIQTVPLGLFPTYCFDAQMPVLRVSYSFGTLTTEFSRIVKVQGRYLPREILFFEGKRKILSATVDTIELIAASDAAFTPSAKVPIADVEQVIVSPSIAAGMLVKKVLPVYPQDAKDARVSGTVVLKATIGIDGVLHDLHVISTPWPSLAASALWSVSHWEYKPYLLNGEPVEVQSTINVNFTLGG